MKFATSGSWTISRRRRAGWCRPVVWSGNRLCLDFHKTARPVRTASVTQVRQPLYRNAFGRWKAYEPYLGDLFQEIHGCHSP